MLYLSGRFFRPPFGESGRPKVPRKLGSCTILCAALEAKKQLPSSRLFLAQSELNSTGALRNDGLHDAFVWLLRRAVMHMRSFVPPAAAAAAMHLLRRTYQHTSRSRSLRRCCRSPLTFTTANESRAYTLRVKNLSTVCDVLSLRSRHPRCVRFARDTDRYVAGTIGVPATRKQ